MGWGCRIDHVYEELHSIAKKKERKKKKRTCSSVGNILEGPSLPVKLCLHVCSNKHGDVTHGAIFMYVLMEGMKFSNTNV